MPLKYISVSQLKTYDIDQLMLLAKKYSSDDYDRGLLRNKLLINFFFEESTRTRVSFEVAAKRLGAEVVNIYSHTSSVKKGEDIRESLETIAEYSPDYIVARHPQSGAFSWLQNDAVTSFNFINAGDGVREHPTQALGDAYTIMRAKGRIDGLQIAFCGDVMRSRVARSNMILLQMLGARLRVITPPMALLDSSMLGGMQIFHDLEKGLRGVDIIIFCRYKKEYDDCIDEQRFYLPYKITLESLKCANDNVVVMHPGPVIRDLDIDSEVLANKQLSLISQQVENCLYMRQALLEWMGNIC